MEELTRQSHNPRLLVSVRNAAEALAALRGGCDILDIKEPARGPLGMSDLEIMAAVTAKTRETTAGGPVPVSAALGELTDWLRDSGAPALPRLDYLKLGPAGLAERSDWTADWQAVRTRIEEKLTSPARWIAVAYADWNAARAPCPEEIVEAAAELGCAGLLVDTWGKSQGRLLDHSSVEDLSRLRDRVHGRGMTLALAGRLTRACLPDVRSVRPDIVAVRSAVCRRQQRTDEVEESAVREFQAAVARAAASRKNAAAGC